MGTTSSAGTILHMHRPAEQTIDIQYMFYKYKYTVHDADWLRETGGVDAVTFCQSVAGELGWVGTV